jgi:hypothetical protein
MTRSPDDQTTKFEALVAGLYQLPLEEFTAARNALAKSLTGDEALHVRKLTKPTLVPWAVNQVFWKARPVYDRLVKAGRALREAQIGTLEGRRADVRRASDAHREAVAEAVRRATALADAAGAHPSPEELARTLEALSLAPDGAGPPGRLVAPLQPAGLEALAGLAAQGQAGRAGNGDKGRARVEAARQKREDATRRAKERAAAQATLDAAERAAEQAEGAEQGARRELARATHALHAAREQVALARKRLDEI